jgi:ribosomal protein S18 acetylase RimI-like enzyme
MGVGRALLAAAESEAKSQGALTITLHVFASNTRARGFYEQSGYDGELLRYIKEFAE